MSAPRQRVLILDDAPERRAALCALLEREGYRTMGSGELHTLVRLLDDGEPTVLLHDVSAPRSWREVSHANAALRSLVAGRCPIVLYGDRPPAEFSELHWGCHSAAHVPTNDGHGRLLALVRRLLPPSIGGPTMPASSQVRAPASQGEPRSGVSSEMQPRGSSRGEPRPQARSSVDFEHAHVRLLLIDDSELTLELMQTRLVAAGFDVRIAIALGEVRSLVANWAPNIIVADAKRPDIPGHELCARLKSMVRHSEALVVLCSSLPDTELHELASAARADGYVSKANGLDPFVHGLRALSKKLLEPNFIQTSARGA